MRADGCVTEGTLPGAHAEHVRVTAPSEVADQRTVIALELRSVRHVVAERNHDEIGGGCR